MGQEKEPKQPKSKEVQQMRKLDFKNFDLEKVKLTSEGLSVTYYEKGTNAVKHMIECEGEPHPDMNEKFNLLQPYMARRLDLLAGWDFARENTRKDPEALAQAVENYNKCVERCKVSGIVYVGKDQLRGIKITGSVKCNESSVGLATPNITFSSEKLGFEQDVEDICEQIRSEVYLYVFSHKRAQEDLIKQIEEIEKEEKGLI